MLLDLPHELLLEIIHFLDPGSFSQFIRVCKTLQSIALGSTPLHNQLGKVPGINDRLVGKDVNKLYKIFKRRSSRNLLHGIDALADVARFTLPDSERLKYGVFMNCSCKTDHLLLAVVRPADASVGVYSIKSQFPILKCVLSPAALDLGPEEDFEFEVVKTAFYDPHERSTTCQCVDKLAVLYRYHLKGGGQGPFVEAAYRQSKELMKLVTWSFTDAFDATIEEVRDINRSLEPRAMAMADDGSAIICYDINPFARKGSGESWQVEWVQRRPNRFYDPFPHTKLYDTSCAASDAPAPNEITIIKRRVWLFTPGIPTPQWEMDDYSLASSIHMSPAPFSMTSRPFNASSFGFPLAEHHKHGLVDPAGDDYCLNSVLQLHVLTEGSTPGAYIVKGVHFPDGCQHYNPLHRYPALEHFIVAELGGLSLAAGATSTLGLVLAVSPRKRRIAVATWKRIQVWVLHPNAFFERQNHSNGCLSVMSSNSSSGDSTETNATISTTSQHSSPGGMQDSSTPIPSTTSTVDDSALTASTTNATQDDSVSTSSANATHGSANSVSSNVSTTTATSTDSSASAFSNDDKSDLDEWPWVDRCGWDYYSCYPRRYIMDAPHSRYDEDRSEIVSLQPVELPTQGVVHALAFNGEDSLWAWTDRGPVRWHFDGGCDARREQYPLNWQVREMNVGS